MLAANGQVDLHWTFLFSTHRENVPLLNKCEKIGRFTDSQTRKLSASPGQWTRLPAYLRDVNVAGFWCVPGGNSGAHCFESGAPTIRALPRDGRRAYRHPSLVGGAKVIAGQRH